MAVKYFNELGQLCRYLEWYDYKGYDIWFSQNEVTKEFTGRLSFNEDIRLITAKDKNIIKTELENYADKLIDINYEV